jgi:hypothetical protein
LALDFTEIYERELISYRSLEQTLNEVIKRYINIRPVSEIELEKLIREPFWRGLPSPKTRGKEKYFDPKKRTYRGEHSWHPEYEIVKTGGEIIYRPLKRDIITLFEGRIIRRLKHIEICQDTLNGEMTGYHKYIVVSKIPDIPFQNGFRWLYEIENKFEFPIIWSVRYSKKDYEEVQKDIGTSRKQLDDQLEHDEQVEGIRHNQVHLEQDQDIDQAIYEVQSEKKPFLYTTVIIGVAAENLELCNTRVNLIRDFLENRSFETQVPAGDQVNLFCETMVGSRQYATDYILRLPPETLAAGMPFASTIIVTFSGL